jgi:hypothetical protein
MRPLNQNNDCERVPMGRQLYDHEVPAEALTFLIDATINGSHERRLAAKMLLDCLRRYQGRAELARCVEQIEEEAIFDIGDDAQELAAILGLNS